MSQWSGLISVMPPPKVRGWRGAGGRGLCSVCVQLKGCNEFSTATGRVCKQCEHPQRRDRLGRFK
jgi:hypothetical protein